MKKLYLQHDKGHNKEHNNINSNSINTNYTSIHTKLTIAYLFYADNVANHV